MGTTRLVRRDPDEPSGVEDHWDKEPDEEEHDREKNEHHVHKLPSDV